MVYIPPNTLLRDKAKSIFKKEGLSTLVKKIDVDEIQGEYHYRRRLNQMIKKRVDSLLKGNIGNIDEAADLMDLINERLMLDGYSLDDVKERATEIHERYGTYSKHYTTQKEGIETESCVFIPYESLGKVITDRDHSMRKLRTYDEKGY